MMKIDLDRGVESRVDPLTGMEVYSYVGQPPEFRGAEPGVWYTAHGHEVDIEMARRAGFDVDTGLKKKHRNDAVQAATDKVLAELALADGSERVVTKERDGFKVIDYGYGRYNVFDSDEELLTPKHLDLRSALILLDELSPPPTLPEAPQLAAAKAA